MEPNGNNKYSTRNCINSPEESMMNCPKFSPEWYVQHIKSLLNWNVYHVKPKTNPTRYRIEFFEQLIRNCIISLLWRCQALNNPNTTITPKSRITSSALPSLLDECDDPDIVDADDMTKFASALLFFPIISCVAMWFPINKASSSGCSSPSFDSSSSLSSPTSTEDGRTSSSGDDSIMLLSWLLPFSEIDAEDIVMSDWIIANGINNHRPDHTEVYSILLQNDQILNCEGELCASESIADFAGCLCVGWRDVKTHVEQKNFWMFFNTYIFGSKIYILYSTILLIEFGPTVQKSRLDGRQCIDNNNVKMDTMSDLSCAPAIILLNGALNQYKLQPLYFHPEKAKDALLALGSTPTHLHVTNNSTVDRGA